MIDLNINNSLDKNADKVRMIVASKLFVKGKITMGQAADMVGLSKKAFQEIIGRHDNH